jgi:hypothetical protein
VRVLDTLTLGQTVVLGTDPGPPYGGSSRAHSSCSSRGHRAGPGSGGAASSQAATAWRVGASHASPDACSRAFGAAAYAGSARDSIPSSLSVSRAFGAAGGSTPGTPIAPSSLRSSSLAPHGGCAPAGWLPPAILSRSLRSRRASIRRAGR